MRKIYTIFILISTISILIVSSCKKEPYMQQGQESDNTKQAPEKEKVEQIEPIETIPYASDEELKSLKLSQDTDIIDYELARKLVVLELSTTNIAENLNWYDATLSKKPIIIYDLNGKPRNYDFIVLKDKKAIGTVRTEARKELTTSVLKSVYPKLIEYNLPATRSTAESSYFIDWQGNEYIGTLNKSRGMASPTNLVAINGSKNITRSQTRDLQGQEIIDYVSENILPKFVPSENEIRKLSLNRTNRDIDELEKLKLTDMKQDLQDKYLDKKQQSVSFWNHIRNNETEILNMPEVALASQKRGLWSWFKKQIDKIWPQHDRKEEWIKKYNYRIHRYNYQHTGAWCGPWVCGYIHYVNYKKDEYDFFESKASSWGGDKPMFPWQMNSALKQASSGAVSLSIIPYFRDKHAFDNIYNRNRPAIRLCFSKGELHWVLAYGVRRMGNALWTDYFFLQIDNGSKIENRDEDPEKKRYYTKVDIWNPWFLVKD